MEQYERENNFSVNEEKAILVAALLPGDGLDPHDPLGELRSLAETAGTNCVDSLLQRMNKPRSATLIGRGKVQELAELVQAHSATVVLFENELSPSQIRNLETEIKCKILDRTELILDIFAVRAQTLEAKLQVELAQLIYTFPRLTGMWTHLERQEGGIGTRGPGETQLETDRRIVQRRKTQLQREIKELQQRKTREVAARNRDHFTVGLVGYTNAGKSSVFNTLTQAGTYADNKLFATLSTLTRCWKLDGGTEVMLSDTVGFVRNLPHMLVASFKATLEEAVNADLLLIVLDIADPAVRKHADTVLEVLEEIGAKDVDKLVLLNKVDAVENNAELLMLQQSFPNAIPVSAHTGHGLAEVAEEIQVRCHGAEQDIQMTVPIRDGRTMQYLETRCEILDREWTDDKMIATVRLGQNQLNQLLSQGTQAEWPNKHGNTKPAWKK